MGAPGAGTLRLLNSSAGKLEPVAWLSYCIAAIAITPHMDLMRDVYSIQEKTMKSRAIQEGPSPSVNFNERLTSIN